MTLSRVLWPMEAYFSNESCVAIGLNVCDSIALLTWLKYASEARLQHAEGAVVTNMLGFRHKQSEFHESDADICQHLWRCPVPLTIQASVPNICEPDS